MRELEEKGEGEPKTDLSGDYIFLAVNLQHQRQFEYDSQILLLAARPAK